MLGGLALKRRWRRAREAAGKSSAAPNLVMGANVQVCWDKFCNHFEVEPRLVPVTPGRYHLDAEFAAANCDENTIGVVAILGSTFDGSYEPVDQIAAALDGLALRTGWDVPIHVDLRLGREGYRIVQQGCRDVAMFQATEIAAMGPFTLVTDGSQLPVFAFTTNDGAGFDVYALSDKLRQRGWQVPAYSFPADCEDLPVCRVVVTPQAQPRQMPPNKSKKSLV